MAGVKKYNGSAWVDAAVKKYNGSAWVQIYPNAGASTTKTISVTSGMNTYRPTWGNWSHSDARQGDSTGYGGSSDCTGCLNLSSAGFTGTGSISSISSASFTGKRGGSGSYGSNQTVKFYRSEKAANSSGDPRGSLAGNFTSTTGGPGSNGTMNNRAITTSQAGLKDWMNGVNSKKILYIRSNTASDFLNILPTFSVTATYTYGTRLLTFTRDEDINYFNRNRMRLPEGDIYHTMMCYENEENMSLNEIIKYRTENNIEDIQDSDLIDLRELMPYYLEHNIDTDNIFTIDLYNTKENHICEISYDGYNYELLKPDNKPNYYKHELSSDFNRFKDNVIVRVRNIEIDSLDMELIIEPQILIV